MSIESTPNWSFVRWSLESGVFSEARMDDMLGMLFLVFIGPTHAPVLHNSVTELVIRADFVRNMWCIST